MEECFGTPFFIIYPQKSNKLCSTEGFLPPPIDGVVLPSGYTRLDYIEGATGCIPTDIVPSITDVLYLDFEFTQSVSGRIARASTMTNTYGYAYFDIASIPAGSYSDASVRFGYRQNAESVLIPLDTARHQTFYSGASVLDDSTSYPTGVAGGPLSLLYSYSTNNNGYFNSLLSYAGVRLYQVALFSLGGELLHNMLPCTNVEGVSGLYDVVSKVFYPYKVPNYIKQNKSLREMPNGGVVGIIDSVSLTHPAASDVQLRFVVYVDYNNQYTTNVTIPQGSTSASVGVSTDASMFIDTSEDIRYFYFASSSL